MTRRGTLELRRAGARYVERPLSDWIERGVQLQAAREAAECGDDQAGAVLMAAANEAEWRKWSAAR